MKRRRMLILLPLLGAMMFWMAGCEMPWESDDDDDDAVGNSTIQGNVNAFATTAAAKAAGGVTVYLEGPVDKSTTTDDKGFFIFSGLPAGTYTVRFEYNGEEVTYRGNSGQVAEITVVENQRVELTGISISGGTVNIGNIHYVNLTPVSDSSDDSEEETVNDESTPASAPSTGTVTMTVNVKRKA